MQVRTLPTLVYPQLPSSQPRQRDVAPVAPQDERSQQPAVPVNRVRKESELQVISSQQQNSRYTYVRVDNDTGRNGEALRVYYEIETFEDRERSELLLGIDITV